MEAFSASQQLLRFSLNCLPQGCPQDCHNMHCSLGFSYLRWLPKAEKRFRTRLQAFLTLDSHYKTSISLTLYLDFCILRTLASLLNETFFVCVHVPFFGNSNVSASPGAERLGSIWSLTDHGPLAMQPLMQRPKGRTACVKMTLLASRISTCNTVSRHLW